MEIEIIVLHKNSDATSFYGLSENGFNWYNIYSKNTNTKNHQRLVNYMVANAMIGGSNNKLVFRLRPILHFSKISDETYWWKSFNLLDETKIISKTIYNEIQTIIEKTFNKSICKYIFRLYVYLVIFNNQNIIINTDNCFFCNLTYDLYCLSFTHSSIICKVCYNKHQHNLKNCIKDINVIKLNEFIVKKILKNPITIIDYDWNEELLVKVLKFYSGLVSIVIV